MAMNKTVKQIAQTYLNDKGLSEGTLNRIEHGIRAFDPCLSCSTHAVGQMPLHVQLLDTTGEVVDESMRG
jgi:NAD-reducing hydrogenase large subunit